MLRSPQEMSLRPTLALVGSLAIILAVGGAIEGWWLSHQMKRGRKSSAPVLTRRDLSRLVTFKHPCDVDKEVCEDPLVCAFDDRRGGYLCLASECETDLQCEPGFSCIAVRSR